MIGSASILKEFRALEKAERVAWRRRLQQPQALTDFQAACMELRRILGFHFHTQAGLEFAREAWIALRIAQALGATSVRLVAGERPDAVLEIGRNEIEIEIVEVKDPHDRRGDRYRDLIRRRDGGEAFFVEEEDFEKLSRQSHEVLGWLQAAASQKSAAGYEAKFALAIYLNWSDYGSSTAIIEKGMRDAVAKAIVAFAEVLVFWQSKVYRITKSTCEIYSASPEAEFSARTQTGEDEIFAEVFGPDNE